MAKPTIQTVLTAWLMQAGCRYVKRLSGDCIVLETPGGERFWYIGSSGSCRWGKTRSASMLRPKHFQQVTGQDYNDLLVSRRLPDVIDELAGGI